MDSIKNDLSERELSGEEAQDWVKHRPHIKGGKDEEEEEDRIRVWTQDIYSDTSVTLPGVCIRIKTWMPRYPGPGQAGLTKGEQDPYRRHLSDRINSVGTSITFILYSDDVQKHGLQGTCSCKVTLG